jgi:uncharacterized protein YrzB (UPF0473 family)
MEHSPEQAEPSVVFVDEEGNEKEMLVIGTFSLQDTTYAVLIDKNRPEEDGVMMKVQENNEEAYLVPIEDDEEWERAVEAYEKWLDS